MPTNIANLFPTVSTPRRLSFVDSENNPDKKTYSSTGLWGKRKMTYAELEMAWKEYNEMEEKFAISYATSEYVDRVLSERLKSPDVILPNLDGARKFRYNLNESLEPERRLSVDEHGHASSTFSDSLSSIYAESCTSEETIRPSRLRRQLSTTLVEFTPMPTRPAPLPPSKLPSLDHESATIRFLQASSSSRPHLHLPSLTTLSVPLQRTKRIEDEEEGREEWQYIRLDVNEEHLQHIEHSNGVVEEPAMLRDRDELLEVPERPPSRLGFFDDSDDDDD